MIRPLAISSSFNVSKFSAAILSRRMSLRNTGLPRIAAPQQLEIDLTETEDTLCNLLNDCAAYLQQEKGISTTCRIAGGWVRDKLLGSQSNDIDVALSDMMGLAFAEHLTEFANSKGVETGTVSKIEQNPDQSKHLETATFKIFGLDIDLVNLRSEEYAEGSRIPTGVSFGTPLQDALRRDITINALFYNVHTRKVEDYTGNGLDDLRNGIVRTPMPPRETFQDDPLRILRCIRFASRFGFEVVEEVKAAVKDPTVQAALVSKVARERVGMEMAKMLEGRDPLRSLQLIHEVSLYHSIFSVIPSEVQAALPPTLSESNPKSALAAASILHVLLSVGSSDSLAPHATLLSVARESSAPRARLYLALALLPYDGLVYRDQKDKAQSVVAAVIRESLKLGSQNHYLDGIPVLFSALSLVNEGLDAHDEQPMERVPLGLLLRNKAVHNPLTGTHWTTTLLFSMIVDLVPHYNVEADSFDANVVSAIVAKYNSLVDRVLELKLQDDVEAKPLLNGREVGNALFGTPKAGPWVGKVLEDVVVWQLGNPSGSKEECTEWLRTRGPSHYVTEEEAKPKSKRIRTK
ncbi:hypothetical protein D9619_003069 [Psilocybe cf. subviscida]|uniref:Poly A polymerase head domain-containing protein n=1 Tax=Psilocybe cf. subviscida TaxID=2480587 RepID=A0A8H5AWX6_9AGAR|nr:hypothetical protein D9619_003069 [Psilocybe cf. subviscida]